MYPLFFIAKNNMKKKKGELAILFLLLTIISTLLYTSVSVLTDITQIIYIAYENAHTADYFFMTDAGWEERIEELLLEQEEVTEYERTTCLLLNTEYRKTQQEEKSSFAFIIGDAEEERNIGKLAGIDIEALKPDDILLPYYMKSSYNQGDSIYITFGEKEYQFQVAGYVEDPLFATPLNVTIYSVYITDECMNTILEEQPFLNDLLYQQHKVRLRDGENTIDFEEKISALLVQEIPELSVAFSLELNSMMMMGGCAFLPTISMALILSFAILLVLVVFVMIYFSIHNFIERNLKNIGILQAFGYTRKQLQWTSVIEIVMIAFFGGFIGIGLGIFASEGLGKIVAMIVGISWKQMFHLSIAILTAILLLFVTAGVALISSATYGKIKVLDALRSGIHTHNFKKNYFPLENSRLPISLVLSGKNIMGEKMKNLFILCIVLILASATCIGFALNEDFGKDTDMLLNLVGIEAADLAVSGEDLREIGDEIEQWDEIEAVLYYSSINLELTHGDNQRTVACDIWEKPELLRNEVIVRGRIPQYDNEIVITTSVAKSLGVDVGDVIYVEGSSGKADYIVSGIDQKLNTSGIKAILTMEGAERLNGTVQIQSINIYTKEGTTFEGVQEKISDAYPELQISNSKQVVSQVIPGLVLGMKVLCIVFVSVTCIVVMMVEIFLIRDRIRKEQISLGIKKALGYTTAQLIRQIMMNNMPIIVIGSMLGAILSKWLLKPLVLICLSFFGIQQCELSVNPVWMVLTVVGIVIVALMASFFMALRVRKIEPVKLLTEE